MDLQTQVEKSLCEKDHLYFARRFFLPRMGFKFMVNWHHVYVAWLIDEVVRGNIANLVINVPPGAGKTELTTNLIPRGLALNPRSRFLYLSFSQSLVEGVSDTARDIVKSKDFQSMWNLQVSNSTDSKKEWKITVDDYDVGHIYVASMGGQVTGRRAGTLADDGFTGCIIIDDPLKPEDAFSKVKRDASNRKLLNTVNSRKAKSDTPIIMIMQRLHTEDPTNFVMTGNLPGEWEQVSIPALIDDAYIATLPKHIQDLIPKDVERDDLGRQSYWPQKESLESLLQLETGGKDKDGATVSRYTFSSQYQQEPKKLGGDLIKSEWFGRYHELPPLRWRAIWADTAQKVKEHNDFSVFLCGGFGYDDKFYIIDVRRGKWLAPELIQEAERFIKKHHVDTPELGALRYMAIEDKASGTTLIQTISRTASIPIRAIQRNTDKLTRTMDVQFYVEDGRVMLPVDAPWLLPYVEEVEGLTADMTHDYDDQWDPTIDGINDTLATPPSLLD